MRDVRGEIELQARRVCTQRTVEIHGARRFIERTQHASHFAVVVAREDRLALEPAKRDSVTLAEAQEILHVQRKTPFANALRCALEIREVVPGHLLVRADEQVSELPASGSRLREELGDGGLQNVFREKKRRLERNALGTAAPCIRPLGPDVGVLIEKPARLALENRCEKLQQL